MQALLHSMHKYYLKLIVEEEVRAPPGEERPPPKTIVSKEFPETTFVAVTAYQNEEVNALWQGLTKWLILCHIIIRSLN